MEVEVKFHLKNPRGVISKLNSIAKMDKFNEFQKDTYYALKSKILRIRESKSGNFISFKERIDKISCNNYYIRIHDAKSLKKILHNFGFKKIATVEKIRSTWLYKDFEIAIDNLKKFGYFIEIESNKKKNFQSVLQKIGAEVGEQDFEGYPKLHKKNL